MVDNENGIIVEELETLFKDKYGAFAMSSNARAIPDARDGLKPVHRRILYTAKLHAPASRGTVKSASIVEQCLAG